MKRAALLLVALAFGPAQAGETVSTQKHCETFSKVGADAMRSRQRGVALSQTITRFSDLSEELSEANFDTLMGVIKNAYATDPDPEHPVDRYRDRVFRLCMETNGAL